MIRTAAPRILAGLLLASLAMRGARAQEQNSPGEGGESGPDAPATSPAPAPVQGRGRVLNGHTFMPAMDVNGALVTTSFASGFVAGYGTTTATWQAQDQTLQGTFDYAGIGAVLGYEYAFLDNLSARAALSEFIYSGIDGRSAVVIGQTLQAGGSAGATFSLPIGDALRLGLLFDASYAPNMALTVGSAVKDVIDSCTGASGCELHPGTAFEAKMLLELTPAIAASWAPTPSLGVTANAAYVFASQTVNGAGHDAYALQLGAALDYDLAVRLGVPIGLQGQFSWLAPTGAALQHVTDLGGGLFYTGKKDLSLGVQVIARRFAVTPDVNVSWSTLLSNVSVRYYW